MGKTNLATDPREQALIPEQYRKAIKPTPLKGRVFVWEMSQLLVDHTTTNDYDANGRLLQHDNAQFRKDLQDFLRIDDPLPEMIWVKPGFAHVNETIKQQIKAAKMDICQAQYNELRLVLLQQGTMAAQWIRTYFLEAPDVYVSQKEYFSNVLLKRWERDPCEDRKKKNKPA